jgi:hypothetical protein
MHERRAPRALPAGNREGAGTDRWVAAQRRAAVPLIGGSGLSAGVVRGSAGAGVPAREGTEVGQAQLNSKVFHLFELV